MLVNTTVSNVSPALTYVPGALWKENTTSEDVDGQAKVYTYHHTNASEGEGRVHFTWFGSGSVWIFGGYRPVLGQYSVRLDGRDALKSPGYKTNDTVVDDAVLFTQSGLAPDVHRLELINTSKDQLRPILGFHRIVVQNDTPNTTDIDTKDSRCQWGPTRTGAKVWMNNGGISTTSHVEGMLTLNFTVGSGISVYGTINPNSSSFSASVDGWSSNTLYPNSQVWPPSDEESLLYTKSGLISGGHTLEVRNSPPPLGARDAKMLSISRILVFDATQPPPSPRVSKRADVAIGAVIGSVLFCILLGVLYLIYRQHRRNRTTNELLQPRPFLLQPRNSPGHSGSPSPPPRGHLHMRSLSDVDFLKDISAALATAGDSQGTYQHVPGQDSLRNSPMASAFNLRYDTPPIPAASPARRLLEVQRVR